MSSTSYSPSEAPRSTAKSSTSSGGRTWIWSLTGICFLFGMLLALQINAQRRVDALRTINNQEPIVMQGKLAAALADVKKAEEARESATKRANDLQSKLASVTGSSAKTSKLLAAQMHELQTVAGITPVTGEGLLITMTDSPDASKTGGDTAFLPGIVHDFDLLQVVNELRAAGAEAISVNGKRITGFSPIRCVGPVIYVNGKPAAAPFRIAAIGSSSDLKSAIEMPGGIVEKLSALVGVKVKVVSSLKIPAAENVPKMEYAKAEKS